jgi:hypothetical protein
VFKSIGTFESIKQILQNAVGFAEKKYLSVSQQDELLKKLQKKYRNIKIREIFPA